MTPIAINMPSPQRGGATATPDPRISIDGTLKKLSVCAGLLIKRGVPIIAFACDRRGPYVWVPPVSWLHDVFESDCANIGHRVEGALRTDTWVGTFEDCPDVRVVWEEPSWVA